jgi:hypothetical protein
MMREFSQRQRGTDGLDAIERAIRGALEKGNAEDRAFREKVYRSVFTALERNLAANPVADEVAQRRREALKARITEIEQEFQPARAVERPEPTPAQPGRGVVSAFIFLNKSTHQRPFTFFGLKTSFDQ